MPNEDPSNEPEGTANLRASRDEAVSRAQAAEERANAAERTMAFSGAGIDQTVNEQGAPNNPIHAMFAGQYQGDATAEAVAAAFSEANLGTLGEAAPPPASEDPSAPSAQNVAGNIGEAFGGGNNVPPATPQSVDPMDEALEEFRSQRRRGVPEENAAEAVVQGVINGFLQEEDGLIPSGRFNYNRDKFHESLQGG